MRWEGEERENEEKEEKEVLVEYREENMSKGVRRKRRRGKRK